MMEHFNYAHGRNIPTEVLSNDFNKLSCVHLQRIQRFQCVV
jgi:hypothetical protein